MNEQTYKERLLYIEVKIELLTQELWEIPENKELFQNRTTLKKQIITDLLYDYEGKTVYIVSNSKNHSHESTQ